MQERIIDVTGAKKSNASNSSGSAHELMTFNFSESRTPVRSLMIDECPWLVAKDICDVLDLSDTNKALQSLDSDEKLTRKIFGSGQSRKMWMVNESGMYALILRSNKPQAKVFRKWVTSEVLPAIRKTGSYMAKQNRRGSFIDKRDVPCTKQGFLGKSIKTVEVDGEWYYNLNELNKAMKTKTNGRHSAKSLNARQQLAFKIWTFGAPCPAWYTNELGLRLIASASYKMQPTGQLEIPLLPETSES